MIFIVLLVFAFLTKEKINAQCYIYSISTKTLCLACDWRLNYDFLDGWPGGEMVFLTTDCKYLTVRPKLEIFISPNLCRQGSSCNGSISDPFDNLIKAFKYAWRNNPTEIWFYLLSDMQENEGSIHFINKADYPSDFQYIFRRLYADIYILPLYCDMRKETGCIRDSSLKPIIFIRTQSLYIFATKNFYVGNVIFDGSEINMEIQKLINSTNEKKRLCQENELNGSINPEGACNTQNKIGAPKKFSYGLFNVETIIECKSCFTMVNNDRLIFNNTEFRYFYSFGEGFGLGSIIAVQSLRFSITLLSCQFKRNMLPNGLINSISTPDYYLNVLVDYIGARDTGKERILKFDGCIFSDHNFLNVKYNPKGSEIAYFISFSQISFEITISNSSFFGKFDPNAVIYITHLIYADIPDSDAKIVNTFTISNNTFESFSTRNILTFKKSAVYNGKRITVVIEKNNFINNTDFCFDLVLSNIVFNSNSILSHSFEACSFIQMNFGNFTAYDNTLKTVYDKYSGAFLDFRGEQIMADEFIFESSMLTNKSYQEGAVFERNTFVDMNLGLIRSNTTLILLIFNKNILQNIGNKFINITSGKVEREFIISNNVYKMIKCSIMFDHEIFKNLSLVNNTFEDIKVRSFIRAWLYSSIQPYSLIVVNDNKFENFLFYEYGFTFEPFYEQTGINFLINRNYFKNFTGSVFGYLFGLSFSLVIFKENIFQQGLDTALIKLNSLTSGDKLIILENCLFEAKFPLDSFLTGVDFDLFLITNSTFIGNRQRNSGISLVFASSTGGIFDVKNSIFTNLSARSAGALMIKVRDYSSVRILNCTFASNEAPELGGDLTIETFFKSPSFVRLDIKFISWFGIINNTFENSQGGNGGSISLLEESQIVIRNNKFYNVLAQNGGTLYVSQRSDVIFYEIKIKLSSSRYLGGSIYANKAYLTIFNCDIDGTTSTEKGGAIFADNMIIKTSFLSVKNSLSKFGGSIYCLDCVLTSNQLSLIFSTATNEGGAMFLTGGRLQLRGGYFTSNSLYSKGGALLLDSLDSISLINIVISGSLTGADGVIFIYGNSENIYKVVNLTCKYSFASGLGDCLYINDGNIIVSTVVAANNKVKGGLFCFYGALRASKIILKNFSILDSEIESNALFVSGCSLYISNALFNNTRTNSPFIFLSGINALVTLKDFWYFSLTTGTRVFNIEFTDMEVENVILRMGLKSGALSAVKCQSLDFKNLKIEKGRSIKYFEITLII